MRIELVLCDFDGTLFDSLPIAYAATRQMFVEAGCTAHTWEDHVANCYPPFGRFYRERGLDLPDDALWKRFLELADFDEAQFFPDVLPALSALACEGFTLGIVSAQKQDVIERSCVRGRISHLMRAIVGDVEDKEGMVRALCVQLGFQPQQVLFIGDMPTDIHTSKTGVTAVGITRGLPVREKLVAAGAHHVIDALSKLLPLLRNGFRTGFPLLRE